MDRFTINFLIRFVFFLGGVLFVNTTFAVHQKGKIIDGDEATIQEFPYQAFLELYDGRQFSRCGGSIISVSIILTAAHCLLGIELVNIRIGSSLSDEGGRTYQSDTFQRHPLFNGQTEDFDVGLVRVEEGMSLDGVNARAIELARLGSDPQEGVQIVITGWGLTDENDTEYPEILRETRTSVVDRQECNQMLGGDITLRMFCAGETTRDYPDTCVGDYGGPAVDEGSGKQIGISSYGRSCGEINSPGVYTRIGSMPIRMFIMAFGGV